MSSTAAASTAEPGSSDEADDEEDDKVFKYPRKALRTGVLMLSAGDLMSVVVSAWLIFNVFHHADSADLNEQFVQRGTIYT